jgi:HprK-related kinase A
MLKRIIRAGRFVVEVQSSIPSVMEGIDLLYETIESSCSDFHIEIQSRRLIKPQAVFSFNGLQPFSPLPLAHAFPLLEWGMNWCVTQHCHQYLLAHAAVVEKNGQVIIMPGAPGSGKSTLCAALVSVGGWRLFSDELALINIEDGLIAPNPRPVSLKNKSIDIIQDAAPKMPFSPKVADTIKGTVAHMRAPQNAVDDWQGLGKATYIIFPKFQANSQTSFTRMTNGNGFIRMAENSFNYHILGPHGFDALSLLMAQVQCYDFVYDGKLPEAMEFFDELVS